jgi:hypothetical protein
LRTNERNILKEDVNVGSLTELQEFVLTKGESLLDSRGEYKDFAELLDILNRRNIMKALFLKTMPVNTNEWEFKQGEKYKCLVGQVSDEISEIKELDDMVLIRQPNSSKNKIIWSRFPKDMAEIIFKLCEDEEKGNEQ